MADPNGRDSAGMAAKAHVAAGDFDGAFRYLLRDPSTVFVPIIVGYPGLAPLRTHPRYREFLRAVKLERYYVE